MTTAPSNSPVELTESTAVRNPAATNVQATASGDRWPVLSDFSAWLISLCIHIAVLLTVAVLWRPVQHGSGGESDRPSGIAVIHQASSGGGYTLVDGSGGSESGDAAAGDPSTSDSSSDGSSSGDSGSAASREGAPVPLDSLLGNLMSDSGGGGGSGSGSIGERAGNSGLSGGNAKGGGRKGLSTSTSVYGIEGKGGSFVYVFDRSASMNEFDGKPLRSAKKELVKSIDSLQEVNEFQIIFYNNAPSALRGSENGGRAVMISAGDNNRILAKRFVNSIVGSGGTEHVSALRLAVSFQPDVIFFLTDADQPSLATDELRSIVDRCGRAGTTIHSIEFGHGPNPEEVRWIQALAEKTGGKFRYVNVLELEQ